MGQDKEVIQRTIVMMPIDSLRLDGGTQMRTSDFNEVTIEAYAESLCAGDKFPPIVVFYDGETYWVGDGFQRTEAHRRVGETEIECEVRQGNVRDAREYALGANATHGLRRSNEDKRNAVREAFKLCEERLAAGEISAPWSDNQIAKLCGVSDKTVTVRRAELNAYLRNSEDSSRTVNRGGTTYTMQTGRIGARAEGTEGLEEFVREHNRDIEQHRTESREQCREKTAQAIEDIVRRVRKDFLFTTAFNLVVRLLDAYGEDLANLLIPELQRRKSQRQRDGNHS